MWYLRHHEIPAFRSDELRNVDVYFPQFSKMGRDKGGVPDGVPGIKSRAEVDGGSRLTVTCSRR